MDAVDVVEDEVRELVRRRGLDPATNAAAVRLLVEEVVTEYDVRLRSISLQPFLDRPAERGSVYDAVAGFGIAAAAERFGLAFVPIAQECYCLALRHDLFDLRARDALVATLRSAEWRALVAHTPGYALPARIAITWLAAG